jgi:hypothetical protein
MAKSTSFKEKNSKNVFIFSEEEDQAPFLEWSFWSIIMLDWARMRWQLQRWAAQHVFQFRNTQFHSIVFVVRKTQLRSVSIFVSALCAMPQLQILPLRTITVRKIFLKTFID